jgi:putative ABC transport system ATP-binding protein
MFQLSYAEAAAAPWTRVQPSPLRAVTNANRAASEPRPTLIELESVSKVFGARDRSRVTAVDNVSIRIPERSITLIKGPSGSGKTTLLGIIGCMMRPTAGRVTVSGHDVTRLSEDLLAEMRRDHFGFVFQNRHLIRRATALENVMVPGLPRHGRNGDLRDRAQSLLRTMGLESKADRRVEGLSGGEQQRVALARALVNDPQVIIADEPTAHLDSISARSFTHLTFDFLSQGKSVIVASHDPAVCRSELFTHVVELCGGRLGKQAGRRWS